MPKISIIVPIYNSEKYIHQCVDSIRSQSFTDFECILVDDGSTDESGLICDQYKKIDSRIKVIHKANGGQSSARNKGMDIATGEYVGFVDSDDWLHPQFYEILYNVAVTNKSDIVNCKFKIVKDDKDEEEQTTYNIDKIIAGSKTYDTKYLLENFYDVLYNRMIDASVCNKLYKKSIFEQLRFEEGMIYEDDIIQQPSIENADRVTLIEQKLYYYRNTPNSTIRSPLSEKNFKCLLYLEDRGVNFPYNDKQKSKFLMTYCKTYIAFSIIVSIYKKEFKGVFIPYRKRMLKRFFIIAKDKGIYNMLKLILLITFINCKVALRLCNKYFENISNNVVYWIRGENN